MASAILVIQGVDPAPYLDVNMARVLERHFGPRKLSDIRYDPSTTGRRIPGDKLQAESTC